MDEVQPALVEDASWDKLRDSTDPAGGRALPNKAMAKLLEASTGSTPAKDKDPFADLYRNNGAWAESKAPVYHTRH